MGQQLFTDKIGTLTHSAGNITMAASMSSPAYLTIGGRQYTVTSNLVVALPTLTANQRYQVFAVVSGGSVILAISTNENSVGPAGYTSWKLVGSFFANGLISVGFGSFLNIEGMPSSNWVDSGALVITATTTSPTQSGNTKTVDRLLFRQNGKNMEGRIEFVQTAAGSNTAGTGDYLFQIPALIDTANVTLFNTVPGQNVAYSPSNHVGSASLRVNTTQISAGVYVFDSNKIRFGGINVVQNFTGGGLAWAAGGTQAALNVASIAYSAEFSVPINSWSITPIKDL